MGLDTSNPTLSPGQESLQALDNADLAYAEAILNVHPTRDADIPDEPYQSGAHKKLSFFNSTWNL